MWRFGVGWLLIAAVCLRAGGVPAAGATLDRIGSFEQPIYVTSSPSDPDRLLVAEREGTIVEVTPQGAHTLADLSSLIACCESERGLLSIAPAPDFAVSGRFYAAYTGLPAAGGAEGDVHLDSFRPDPGTGGLIREPILSVPHASQPNHNGGQLQFGPDGHLYLSLGDGGGGGDPEGNGQDTEALLGKILRIDPRTGQVPAYAIPSGNPFALTAGRDEIWAYGLRNPWRFSFDRGTGDMVIADVGQDTREEIDVAASPSPGVVGGAGVNYGWNCREGKIAFPGAPGGCAGGGSYTEPVFDYPHGGPGGGAASGCSIIGGYVVRDSNLGDLFGRYIYTDYCSQELRSLALGAASPADSDRSEGLNVDEPTSFGEDACGRVYVASAAGPVYRLQGVNSGACPVVAPIATRRLKRPRLRLTAKRLRPGSLRFGVKVRLVPCEGNAGRRVLLKRHGQHPVRRRLNRRCAARFVIRADRRTVLRAEVRLSGRHLHSNRLALGSRRAQRSQVRTIALAKPMP